MGTYRELVEKSDTKYLDECNCLSKKKLQINITVMFWKFCWCRFHMFGRPWLEVPWPLFFHCPSLLLISTITDLKEINYWNFVNGFIAKNGRIGKGIPFSHLNKPQLLNIPPRSNVFLGLRRRDFWKGVRKFCTLTW